jgi:diguanylate cyclase (GGDEF)-like protein
MRLVRLAALFGSLVLLVATTVSLLNRRSEIRADQNARVQAAAEVGATSVSGSINTAIELVDLTVRLDDAVEQAELADALTDAFPTGDACVRRATTTCTGPDLFGLSIVSVLAPAAAGDEAAAGIDDGTSSLVVVGRGPTNVVIRVPIDDLIDESTRESFDELEATVEVFVAQSTAEDAPSEPRVDDGVLFYQVRVDDRLTVGALDIVSAVDGEIGLAGDASLLFGALLALGTVLLALAGWTFLAERRSLERRATTDELTGLVNRREFERISEEALFIGDRFATGLCVMVLDLNGFKQINDTRGHQVGDVVLQRSAERLQSAVRDTDVVGRWGGDEFVILLPGLDERSAVRTSAERIASALGGSPIVDDTTITGSIGAAIYPRHGTTLDDLMRAADEAMYSAKTSGVTHRIADTIEVQSSLSERGRTAEPPPPADTEPMTPVETASPTRIVDTDAYSGPDRRKTLPPPIVDLDVHDDTPQPTTRH